MSNIMSFCLQKSLVKESVKKIASIIPKEETRILRSRMRQDVISKSASNRESSVKSEKTSPAKKRLSLDGISRKLFPITFFIFTAIYWTYYLQAIKR